MEESRKTRTKTPGQKTALLLIMKYFLEKTDEEHPVNAAGLQRMLERNGLYADRRTIYSDVAMLQDFGLDLLKAENRRTGGWYIGSRTFELAELKLLADAVQASRFITERKSAELIRKLGTETSEAKAKELNREVFVGTRAKSDNESILYNVDGIHRAIRGDAQIQFQYGEINLKKHLVLRRGGARYQVSPWALVWQDENYYLVAFDADAGKIKHYRVDKMLRMKVLDEEKRLGGSHFRDFDLAAYVRKTFGMYGGEEIQVTFRFPNYLAGVVTERFGYDVIFVPDGQDFFHVTAPVVKSTQFFGWLAGLGSGAEILTPRSLRAEYRNYLLKLADRHR